MCKYLVTITVQDKLYQSENDSLVCVRCKPSEIVDISRKIARNWIPNSHFSGGVVHMYLDKNNYRSVWVGAIEPLTDGYYAVMSQYLPEYDTVKNDGTFLDKLSASTR